MGNRVLDKVQLGILAKGNALYLPENDRPASRHLLYCMADFTRNKLLVSGEPFPIRTYRGKGRYPASLSVRKKKYRRSERLPRKSTRQENIITCRDIKKLKYHDMEKKPIETERTARPFNVDRKGRLAD